MSLNEKAKNFCFELGVSIEAVESRLREAGEYHAQRYFSPLPQHYVGFYFATTSLVLENAKNILEIGVGVGRTTHLLSLLFPDTVVYTLDVPASDKENSTDAYVGTMGEVMKKNLEDVFPPEGVLSMSVQKVIWNLAHLLHIQILI